jgi:hypothetical protein
MTDLGLVRLDAAIRAAGVPIDGVSSDGLVAFQASATDAQKAQAAAIVAGFDSSPAADATYAAQRAKTSATSSLDAGGLQSGVEIDRLVRALALVTLDEINILRTAAALAPRTAAQLVTGQVHGITAMVSA